MTSVLTIGHSNHPVAAFVELLRAHGVDAVADVRTSPWSRYQPDFNKDALGAALKAAGIAYVFLGRELGGRPEDPACYVDGRVRYDLRGQFGAEPADLRRRFDFYIDRFGVRPE